MDAGGVLQDQDSDNDCILQTAIERSKETAVEEAMSRAAWFENTPW
jgi:hypothetical protein